MYRSLGVMSRGDLTNVAALAMMMWVLGQKSSSAEVEIHLQMNMRGEVTF